MELTLEQLQELLPRNPDVEEWYESLSIFLPKYEIDTTERIAAFIAQCSHESGGFTVLRENLNYRWQTLRKVFPKYFSTDELAQRYASLPNKQEAIANRVYANRMGNGPESSGDGFRYRGRGLIQLTGFNNYKSFSEYIGMSIEETVDYMETFDGAVECACWYWKINSLNRFADSGDFISLTRRINGGTIGLEDRKKHYEHALLVLNDSDSEHGIL
jgi:putative chitinase